MISTLFDKRVKALKYLKDCAEINNEAKRIVKKYIFEANNISFFVIFIKLL